jgi:cytochrome c-type biogenesis protein CcmH/NrfG
MNAVDFDYREALLHMVKGLLDGGRAREAYLHLQRLVANYPQFAEGYWYLGETCLRFGMCADARKAFARAVALDPNHVVARAEMEMLSGEDSGVDRAVVLLQGLIRRSPQNVDAISVLGRIALVSNKTGESISLLQRVAAMRPDNAWAHLDLGKAFLAANLPDAAQSALAHALDLGPEMAEAHHALTVLHWNRKDTDKSKYHISKAIQLEPRNSVNVKDFAKVMAQVGEMAAARLALEHFLDTVGDDHQVRGLLAELDKNVWQTDGSRGRLHHARPMDRRLVVFIGDEPRVRQAKMAYGLREAGWQVALLYKNEPNFALKDYFHESQRYYTEWDALELAGRYAARVYHVFSPWYDETSLNLIRHKPGKVVYDYTDVFAEIKTADAAKGVPYQQFCVENADGLCCRDLRMQHTIRNLGHRSPPHVILFPDYCWDLPDESVSVDRMNDGIHVVSCGSFGIEKRGETDNGYLDIAKKMAARGVHLHLYPVRRMIWGPMSMFQDAFSDYLELAARTPFVHVHGPVPMEQVISEMSRYQVGASIVRVLSYGERPKGYTEAHFQYCGSTRIFDYLDAGLPILLNKAYGFQFDLLARHGIVIDATPEMLTHADEFLRPCVTPAMRERVLQARSAYGVRRQIGQLTAFYESL